MGAGEIAAAMIIAVLVGFLLATVFLLWVHRDR